MSYISKCSKEFWGRNKTTVLFRKICCQYVRFGRAAGCSAGSIFFELAGGSIPSTTGGWDDLFLWWGGQRENIFFSDWDNSLANCSKNFGRLLVFPCLLVVANFFSYWPAALDVWDVWLRFLAFGLHYGVQLYRNIIIGCLGFPVRLLGFQLFCLARLLGLSHFPWLGFLASVILLGLVSWLQLFCSALTSWLQLFFLTWLLGFSYFAWLGFLASAILFGSDSWLQLFCLTWLLGFSYFVWLWILGLSYSV